MIEVVSYPVNLAEWDAESEEQPFYFELYGETKPIIAMDFAQVIPVGKSDGSPQAIAPLPIYEYSWTIGHSSATHLDSLWSQLQEPAAKVFLYFPISRGCLGQGTYSSSEVFNSCTAARGMAAKDFQTFPGCFSIYHRSKCFGSYGTR